MCHPFMALEQINTFVRVILKSDGGTIPGHFTHISVSSNMLNVSAQAAFHLGPGWARLGPIWECCLGEEVREALHHLSKNKLFNDYFIIF